MEMPPHAWTQEFLESKRLVTDPEADETIRKIFESSDPSQINNFYASIQRTTTELPADLPDYLKSYFEQASTLPPWANPALISRAEQFYITHGGMIALVLCAKSLPECYACAKGAKVLFETGRLSEKNGSLQAFTRRIAETAQFVVNAMSPRALSPYGLGIRSAQKVRLIHASIRYYLKKQPWDVSLLGEPVNQEDLAGTLMSFAPLVIQGLETLGVEVTPEEKEAYFHSWRVIGYFLGINDDLLPNNYADALALGYAIFDQQKKSSPEGIALTKSLIEFMTHIDDNNIFHFVIDDLLRMMVGDETADMLGIPTTGHKAEWVGSELAKKFLGGWENILDRHSLLKIASVPLNRLLLNGMLKFMNNGEKIHFFIPPSLQQDWGLNQEPV
jgi:ER-bound oxygenase mpaB/B'/Rubber oxygenase, catalytic domain